MTPAIWPLSVDDSQHTFSGFCLYRLSLHWGSRGGLVQVGRDDLAWVIEFPPGEFAVDLRQHSSGRSDNGGDILCAVAIEIANEELARRQSHRILISLFNGVLHLVQL